MFDAGGNVTLDAALSIETMDWILGLRDTHGIATQAPATGDEWWAVVNDGKFISQVGADWYGGFFKDNAPDLKGKWKAIPLPAWEAGGPRQQEMLDGAVKPTDVFTEVSEAIRKVIAEEKA